MLAEIAGLADPGVQEVTLLGQNVNAYRGVADYGEEDEIPDFALLLEYVPEIPGIERIRYTMQMEWQGPHTLMRGNCWGNNN